MILIHVVNKISFGWEIHFLLPLHFLIPFIVLVLITTVFAGYLPSKIAGRIDPKRFVSFE
jgi:ABC-type antimicrobial peptide transport system permease subunit